MAGNFDIVLIQKDSGFRPGDVLATPAPLPTGAEKVPNPALQVHSIASKAVAFKGIALKGIASKEDR